MVALLAGSVSQSKADGVGPSAAVIGTSDSAGAGAWLAGGIIVVAAALCVYDLGLKINGVKNWDGTEKRMPHAKHYH